MSNTQSRTRGEQKSPTLMNNAQSTENQVSTECSCRDRSSIQSVKPSSSPSSERITEVSQAPSSARAKRAARRSSGMPASPAVKSPTRGQRRRSSSDGQPAALAQEDLQPESSPAQGSVPSTERSTNHNEGPEVIGADHPTETVADEETHQTLHREEKEQLAESIPSDLAEFRREMALEASGIAVPTPEEHQSNTTDVFSTPQRQMPKAPRKSALKNPSRPTSPNDTPAPPSLKRKVSFSGTTEYKTIAGIHDEEYKREQREMCFVGEVKRRRTSARISHAHDDKDDQGSASSSMPTPSAVPKSSSSTPSKPLAEGHQQTTQTEPSDLLSHSLTTGESGVHQTARTPVKSPSKARRVPTKTPPAAVRQAHYDLQLQTATRGDAPDKQPTLPKPGRSVSPAKRSKAEVSDGLLLSAFLLTYTQAQQNMAQLLASPAPKLNHTVFHSPAKVMTEPSPSLPVQQPESVAADGHSTIEGVRAQLQSFRDRQSLSPFKAPMIHLSPATFGLSEPPAQAPPSPSPSSQGKNASEVKTEDNVKPPSTASFTPFLSGVKHMLQLHQAPKTPSFAGLSSMFKEPSLKYETVDWSSHLDPSLFKSPAKVTGTAQTDGSSKGRQSQDSKDEQPCNVSDATAQKPSGIPSMRAKRSTGKSTEAATPQTGGTARRTTRAATGSLKSRVPFKPDTASATSRMGTASAPLRTRATPSVDGRKPPASAKSRSASTTASSQAKARSATSKPASQALASAPPPRRELNKENARQSASRSAATTRRQAASAGTRL